jgi:radical SAM-linked protein
VRVRIRFNKVGKVRFVSHRDVARIWERAFRRAGVSVAYSQGFSPRPKLSFGLALSTGHESDAEYLDVELVDDRYVVEEAWGASGAAAKDLSEALTAALPTGMCVVAMAPITKGDSLQQAVVSCTWAVELDGVERAEADAWVADVLSREEIVVERERKGKSVVEDLRPQVLSLRVDTESGTGTSGVRLLADLGTQPRALRPTELLVAVDPPLVARSVRRMNQWMSQGADREEPLTVAVAPAPPTTESA